MPGTHTPWHAPETHADDGHDDAVLHVPSVLHDSTPLPEHVVCPCAQTPLHAPPTHVWLVHAVAFCQVPVPLHVCGWLDVLHCV